MIARRPKACPEFPESQIKTKGKACNQAAPPGRPQALLAAGGSDGTSAAPFASRLTRTAGVMSSGKRQFPYYSTVEGFELQRRRLEDDPGRCAARLSSCNTSRPSSRSSVRSSVPPTALLHTFRDKEGPKVWQAREQTAFDEYDAITVSGCGGCSGPLAASAAACPSGCCTPRQNALL